MATGFDEAYEALKRAQECLEQARQTDDPVEKGAKINICIHSISQSVRYAHRCFEVCVPPTGSSGGGAQTWAQNELEAFMQFPIMKLKQRGMMTLAQEEADCELWLNRAKFFVDKMVMESHNVATPVYEETALWENQNINGWLRWDAKEFNDQYESF